MDVFLQIRIQYVLQHTWKAVVIFRHNKNKAICARHCSREFAVLKCFAGVIHTNGDFPDVDQVRFGIATFRYFTEYEIRGRFRQTALSRRADHHRNENGPRDVLRCHAWTCRSRVAQQIPQCQLDLCREIGRLGAQYGVTNVLPNAPLIFSPRAYSNNEPFLTKDEPMKQHVLILLILTVSSLQSASAGTWQIIGSPNGPRQVNELHSVSALAENDV